MIASIAVRPLPALAIVVLLGARTAAAQDWPQWRGPSRDGSVPAAQIPAVWPASFAPAWRVEIGEGYS